VYDPLRQERTGPVACLALLCICLTGCAGDIDTVRKRVLFTEGGAERRFPSTDVRQRLLNGDEAARRRMIGQLVEVIKTDGGYSRVAAARGLLMFLVEYPQYYNERIVDAIAEYAIAIGPGDEKYECAVEWLTCRRELPGGLEERLRVRLCVAFDAREYFLVAPDTCLPYKWTALEGAVFVDGNCVYHATDYRTEGGLARIPDVKIDLKKALLRDEHGNPVPIEKVIGDHVIRSTLTVRATNGSVRKLEQRIICTICRQRDFL